MKNILKSFATFALATLAIASCKNSELVPETPKGPTHTVKFTAGVPETKTNMQITQEKDVIYTWTAEDLNRLSVYENGSKGRILNTSTISAESLVVFAEFDGEASAEEKKYTAVLNSGVVENQTPRVDAGSYDENADVLVAKPIMATAAEGIEFQFKRVVAVNKMNLLDLPVGETISTVTITSDKPIAGLYENGVWDATENEIVLTVNKQIPNDGKLTLYYMAIPVEEAILTVEATIGTDSYLKKFGKTLTTSEGDVKGYSVGLKKQAHIVLTENFNSNHTTSTTYGGTGLTSEIAADWNYTWSFSSSNIYASMNTVRFGTGTSTALGYIQSADILSAIPAGAEFKVLLYAAKWDTNTTIKLTYNGEDSTQAPANEKMSSPSGSTYNPEHFTKVNTFTLTKVADVNNLKIGNVQDRFILDKLVVSFDGDAPSAINANDVTDVAAAGVVDATFNFSVVNIIGTPAVTPDGTVVTAASVEGNTVTYTVAENTAYAAREGSIIITVGDESKTVTVSQLGKVPEYEGDGTLGSPYTVADALMKIQTLEPGASSEEVYVTGPIKSVESYNDKFGSISYKIGVEETVLDIYGGLDFDGAKFAGTTDLAVGQNVVVRGNLKDHEGTKEMDANNKLVSVNGKTYLLKSISVTGAKTNFDQGDEFSKGEAVVTATYRGSKENTNVTSSAQFTGYDGSQLGTQDITVSYTEDEITKTTTYQVSVADVTPRAIHVAEYDTSKGTVTVTANGNPVTEARIGTEIVVTVTTETGFVVDEFTVNDEPKTLTKGVYQFTMDENDVTIAVTFKVKPLGYERVTSVSEITSGDYVIAAKVGEKYYAMPTTLLSSVNGVEIAVDNDIISADDAEEYLWSVTKSGDDFTFTKGTDELGWSSSTNFTKNSNTNWNIAIGTSTAEGMKGGTFAILNKASVSSTNKRFIIYNGTKFGAYTETNTNNTYYYVELFKLEDNRTPQTIGFTSATGTYDIYAGGTRSIPSLTGAMTTVTYASSDETVVTVNPSTGAVTNAKKVGHATITATAAANETYKSATAEYTLNIVDTTPKTDLVPPTDLTWTEGSKTLSWTDSNTSKGTYGTNYKYQYSVGDEAHYVDATSATGQELSITTTKTVYVKAVAITTNTHNSSASSSLSCEISSAQLAGIPVEFTGSTTTVNNGVGNATITNSKSGSGHNRQNMAASANDYWLFTIPVQNLASGTKINIAFTDLRNNKAASNGTYTFVYYSSVNSAENQFATYTEGNKNPTAKDFTLTMGHAVSDGTLYIKMKMTSGGATNGGNHYLGDVSISVVE